jgi:hypothetical protein
VKDTSTTKLKGSVTLNQCPKQNGKKDMVVGDELMLLSVMS